jgi:SNF2 family DNA or RNA helicase
MFDRFIVQKWKTRSDPNAIASLKLIINSITLRRPKSSIALPPRVDRTIFLDFEDDERAFYEASKRTTLRKFKCDEQGASTSSFLNALQWINGLRLICNHGIAHQPMEDTPPVSRNGFSTDCDLAQSCFEELLNADMVFCSECLQDLTTGADDETIISPDLKEHPLISEGLRLVCAACFSAVTPDEEYRPVCNHIGRPCILRRLDTTNKAELPIESGLRMPTKIKALVQELVESSEDQKRQATISPLSLCKISQE